MAVGTRAARAWVRASPAKLDGIALRHRRNQPARPESHHHPEPRRHRHHHRPSRLRNRPPPHRNLDKSGKIRATDPYDGEIWSTFFGPAHGNYIKLADYSSRPVPGNGNDDFWILEISRNGGSRPPDVAFTAPNTTRDPDPVPTKPTTAVVTPTPPPTPTTDPAPAPEPIPDPEPTPTT
jgi:hypothetical protein